MVFRSHGLPSELLALRSPVDSARACGLSHDRAPCYPRGIAGADNAQDGASGSRTDKSPGQLLPVADLLVLAERLRAAGRSSEAEATCRRVLAVAPNTAEALHILGLIAHQAGRIPGDAIGHLRHAVAAAPGVPLYHANLGEMYRLAGQIEHAIAEGRQAVTLQPQLPRSAEQSRRRAL